MDTPERDIVYKIPAILWFLIFLAWILIEFNSVLNIMRLCVTLRYQLV